VPQPTPYLAGATATGADFRRGVNFAFGGATALDLHFFVSRGLGSFVPVSLRNQTVWFHNVLRLLGSARGMQATAKHLSYFSAVYSSTVVIDRLMLAEQRKTMATSLFLVGEIGVNDYFIGLNENRTVGEVRTFVPHVVGAIRSVITVRSSRLLLCSRSFSLPTAWSHVWMAIGMAYIFTRPVRYRT
jgi:hypothetical protein